MADANRIAALEQELAGLRDPHPLSEAQIAGAAAALLEKQWDSTGEKAKQYYLVTHPEVTRDLFSKRKLRTIDPSNYVSPQ